MYDIELYGERYIKIECESICGIIKKTNTFDLQKMEKRYNIIIS